MKFIIFIFIIFFNYIYADANQKLFDLYQKGMYVEACNYGYSLFAKQERNEPFISLMGFSCLKSDQIDRLSPVISALAQTAEARANSTYFTLIVMQKKLLMRALYDNQPLQNLKFPSSNHLISKVFDLYVQNPKKSDIIKEYQDPINSRQSYRLYTTQANGLKTIAIDEYYDKILTSHHVY